MKECNSVSGINSSNNVDIPYSPGSLKNIIETQLPSNLEKANFCNPLK